MSGRVFIALGANLPHPIFGAPVDTMSVALDMLADAGVQINLRSSWWQSGPVPATEQPDYINAVVDVESPLGPGPLLELLHRVEGACGRVRAERWGPRTLDLDLIDYGGLVLPGQLGGPELPHPRMSGRLFVLLPLQEIAPLWRHPVSGQAVSELVSRAESIKINKL